MMICRWIPLMSHNWAEFDHIRLLFFQIKVGKGKRAPPGFQFFCLFYDVFDVIWPENQSQCSILSQGGSTQLCLGYFDLQPRHKIILQLKTGWTPLSFFNPNLEKRQCYMVNLCSIVWHQRDSTDIPSLVVYAMYFK